MGPDEKDTGPLTVYMDGHPVGVAPPPGGYVRGLGG